jgi:hypothetical protein
MTPKYVLVQPSEDGPITFLESLDDVLDDPGGFGIDTFLTEVPDNQDPNYWEEGDALLLSVEVVKVKVKATKYAVED